MGWDDRARSQGRAAKRGFEAPTVGEMSTGWLGNIDSDRVSEVLLVDGWHSIDVPSFAVNPSEESFSFDETLAHTHTSTRTRVVFGPLSAVLAVSYGEVT